MANAKVRIASALCAIALAAGMLALMPTAYAHAASVAGDAGNAVVAAADSSSDSSSSGSEATTLKLPADTFFGLTSEPGQPLTPLEIAAIIVAVGGTLYWILIIRPREIAKNKGEQTKTSSSSKKKSKK